MRAKKQKALVRRILDAKITNKTEKQAFLDDYRMKAIHLSSLVFIVAILASIVGCSTIKYVPVERVVRDSTKVTEIQYDSIYVYKDRLVDRGKDTIYIHDKEVEYRYKLLRDTLVRVQIDSIPYEVRVEVTKEVPRKLSIIDKLAYLCLGLVLVWITIKVINKARLT